MEEVKKKKGKPRGRTGPRTKEGKKWSSMNALRYGRYLFPNFFEFGEDR